MTQLDETVQSNGVNCAPRHEEYQYLDLIRDILQNGEHRPDRYAVICP